MATRIRRQRKPAGTAGDTQHLLPDGTTVNTGTQQQLRGAIRRRRSSGAGGNVAWNRQAGTTGARFAGGSQAYPPIELSVGQGANMRVLKIPIVGLFL